MADYKELLRKAIEALPENNGTARRGVYEKARSALVGQLRAIQPPLPAKDITQHRLQLEDCIREVEKEASEAVISLKRQEEALARAAATPAPVSPKVEPPPTPVIKDEPVEAKPLPAPVITPVEAKAPEKVEEPKPTPESMSVEDIIAQAESSVEPEADKPSEPASAPIPIAGKSSSRPMPSIVSRTEPASGGGGSAYSTSRVEPIRRAGEPRRDGALAASAVTPYSTPRIEPSVRSQTQAAVALQTSPVENVRIEPDVLPAMSSVREVDIEAVALDVPTADAQGAIDRAIATLDREARGEPTADGSPNRVEFPDPPARRPSAFDDEDEAFPSVDGAVAKGGIEAPRGSNAVSIFLIVFVVLLAAAGGGAYYAVREGYIDLAAMFGSAPVTAVATTQPANDTPTSQMAPAIETSTPAVADPDPASSPGNTTPGPEATTATAELTSDDAATPDSAVAAVDSAATALTTPTDPVTADTLALAPTEPAVDITKSEERLPNGDVAAAMPDAQVPTSSAAVDPAAIAGSQSLLLEASDVGTTGAVPFSGTVEWSKGADELGQPTLVGKANIPARNLGVDILIRKNADPSLPASHLMEINFDVSQTFIGGSIASLPGVLLKNEELVQGTPLVGASARVVGNSFLFALSASTDDSTTNENLLTSRKWIDLAIVYATGKRAIITLEKDPEATALFTEVFSAWDKPSDTASSQ